VITIKIFNFQFSIFILILGLLLPGLVKAEEASRPGKIKERVVEKIRKNFPRAALGKVSLTAISGSTLTVSKDGKTYSVQTGTFEKCTTKFVRRFSGNSTLSELTVGDTLEVVGRWADETKTTAQACVVRNLSIQKKRGTFVGDVVSVSDTGFVMTTVSEARENQTVTISTSTKLVNRKEVAISLADVKVGHRVRVKGLWNRTNNTITETTHVKDYNLPAQTGLPEKQVKNEVE